MPFFDTKTNLESVHLFWDTYKSDVARWSEVSRQQFLGRNSIIWHGSPDNSKIPTGSVASEQFDSPAVEKNKTKSSGEDSSVLSNFAVVEPSDDNGMSVEGEGSKKILPKQAQDILEESELLTRGWPKRIGLELFYAFGSELIFFSKVDQYYAWLCNYGRIDWLGGTGLVKRAEFFHFLEQKAERFGAIEKLPHWPPLRNAFYLDFELPDSDGSALRQLVSFFRPETTADRELIKAQFITPAWGGQPGGRPAFANTSDDGRGSGKTKLTQAVADLYCGAMDFCQGEDVEAMKSRLLSPEAATKRIAVLDNVKSYRFSWSAFEALITAAQISGKKLYHGESSRENHLTWILSLNAPSLSTDVAQRCIIVKLVRGENEPGWWEAVSSFIAQNRARILSDCIQLLKQPAGSSLTKFSRWAAWERAVLSKLENADQVQEIIVSRQGECDADQDGLGIVEDYFRSRLRLRAGRYPHSSANSRCDSPRLADTGRFNFYAATTRAYSASNWSGVL